MLIETDDYINPNEFAKRNHIGEAYARTLALNGKIPSIKVAGHILIPVTAVMPKKMTRKMKISEILRAYPNHIALKSFAAMIGLSEQNAAGYARRGSVKAKRIGGYWIVERDDARRVQNDVIEKAKKKYNSILELQTA